MDFADIPKLQQKNENIIDVLNVIVDLAKEYNISEDKVLELLLKNNTKE